MLPLERNREKNIVLPELDPYNLSQYIITDYITRKDEIFVLSLKSAENSSIPINIDRSMIYRNIYELLSTQTISTIVINDAPQNLIDGLFKMYAIFSKDSTDFFPKGKMVLLFSKNKKGRKYKEGVVIAGKTEIECKKINKYISNKRSYFKVLNGNYLSEDIITKEEGESINNYLTRYPLFSSTGLINFDFFEKGNCYFEEGGDYYFEQKAEAKLKKSINDDTEIGYNWEHTHLKISSKLHLDNFVYGKKMFQRSSEASDFAFLIARDIFKNIKEEVKNSSEQIVYTLVGYGYYSELLVSRTCDFVNRLFEFSDIRKKNVYCEYIIVKDEDKINFSRYIHNLEARKNKHTLEKLIIIVPISSTLTTCFKIENAFKEKDLKKYTENHIFELKDWFYTPVVVSTDIESDVLKGYFKDETLIEENHNKTKSLKNIFLLKTTKMFFVMT